MQIVRRMRRRISGVKSGGEAQDGRNGQWQDGWGLGLFTLEKLNI